MKVAVVTANIGDIDELLEVPTQLLEPGTEVSYITYTEKNLPFPLPSLDNRMKSKYLKIQTHKFLTGFDYVIWLDGRIQVIDDSFVMDMIHLVRHDSMAIGEHQSRKNVFDELGYILYHIEQESPYIFLRYGNQKMDKEHEFYLQYPELSKVPLHHCACFIRRMDEKTNEFFDKWWQGCIEFSNFDQAMFSYISYIMPQVGIRTISRKIMDLMIRNNKHQRGMINVSTEDLYYRIKESLIKKKPLAVTRYGDGEAMVLDKDDKDAAEFVFKRQLGELSDQYKSHVVFNLRDAYKDSDIIGIPTSRHIKKGGHWLKSYSVLERWVPMNKDYASIDFHYELLESGLLDKILQNRKKLFYISAHNLDERFKERYGIEQVISYQIPPERKFSPDYKGDAHYPTAYRKINEWIKEQEIDGDLCLVGAGVVGKMYNIWFKQAGGVSIDVGSVFDAWAGKKTRGNGRGAGQENLNYLL